MAFPQRVFGVLVLASVTLLSGCGSFFQCEGKTSCPASGTTGDNTGDFVYVSNSTTGSNNLAGYSIASGALTAISGATPNLGFVPVAMNVSPNNKFLYVASSPGSTTPGVYLYTISSTGALALGNNGNALINDDTISSMDVSPDGNYLFTVGTSTVGVILNQYTLNTSTGAVSAGPTTLTPGGTDCTVGGSPISQQCTVKVSPNGNYVAVALGTYGVTIYPYGSSGGITNVAGQYIAALNDQSGDYSLALDKNNYLYVASTLALTSYGGIGGTAVTQSTETYGAKVTPRSVTLSTDYSYVYTANEGAASDGGSSISGFALNATGVMTAIGSAVSGPTNVSAIGADNSGKYLVAAGYNVTNGLQLYNITSTGALTSASSVAGTGTSLDVPVLIALSH
jgi:6-phosphogluconolactonase